MEKTRNSRNGWKCPTWGGSDPPRPLISQNPKSSDREIVQKLLKMYILRIWPNLGSFWTPKGVLTPPGPALPPISGISSFFRSFLYIKRTQKTHDCFQISDLVRIREGLVLGKEQTRQNSETFCQWRMQTHMKISELHYIGLTE